MSITKIPKPQSIGANRRSDDRIALEEYMQANLKTPLDTLKAAAVIGCEPRRAAALFQKMRDSRTARMIGKDKSGRGLYVWHTSPLQEHVEKPKDTTPARTYSKMEGQYDGRELRPFAGRPGAMDAYALPSLGYEKRGTR